MSVAHITFFGEELSFYEFMQSFHGDDTSLGELVDWINQDINFPKEVKSHSEILTYFRNNPCPENIPVTVIKRALAVFNQFTQNV